MRKKIIISLVCLLSILGITAYCFVNRKTDGSEQVTEVSKQEVKTVKKAIKQMLLVNKQQQKKKVQKHPLQAKIRLHHKTKQRLLLKIQTIRVKRKHWTTLQPTNLIRASASKK